MRTLIGRKQVIIPISKEDFYEDVIGSLKKHLSSAISIHKENVSEIEYLHKHYLGKQDILCKKRYDGSEINNIVVENHTNKQVNFKVGFMYGNPLEYTIINEEKINKDDMTYLNSYLIDSNKSSLDIEKAQDLYEFGIAYQRVIPKRTDIEDIKTEAPFELVNMPVENTCVVYSNDIPNEKLFALVVSEKILNNISKIPETIYQIFLPNRKIEIDSKYTKVLKDIAQPYPYIPIIDFWLNRDRIGIIELGLSMQELINKIDSSQIDDIDENVNAFLIFLNQKFDEKFKKDYPEMKKQRMLAMNTGDPNKPADVKFISTKLDQENVNEYYERILKAWYDIVGVPQASGNVTSGGDTGQARLLGNGWESAQNQGQVDQTYLVKFERELLKAILWCCKNKVACPVDSINASDVAIKFNINMSNNLLIKAEALKMLDEINFPEKTNLTICGITKDVDGVGKAWEEKKKKVQEEQKQEEKVVEEKTITKEEIDNK